MKISIVLPAYNEEKMVGLTLEALSQLEIPGSWEIILVDNASTDGTKAVAEKFFKKLPLRIIREPRKGRGRARATGFAAAKGEFIFSTDADTWPPRDWVTKLLAPFTDPDVVATTCSPIITDASPWTNRFYNKFAPTYFWLNRRMIDNNPLVGFSFAIRKSVYEKSGGFNPDLKAEEDIDLGLRVAKLGKIVFVPDVRVITSGRRWQKGPAYGLWGYLWTTISRWAGKPADLSDVR